MLAVLAVGSGSGSGGSVRSIGDEKTSMSQSMSTPSS
jgi:hypothetical protein